MTARMSEDLALSLALDGRAEPADLETKALVGLAERLAALPDPEIDERFAAALEARLLSEGLSEAPAPVTAARPRLTVVPATRPQVPVRRAPVVQLPRRRFVLRRGIAAAAVAAMLGAFPAAAMAGALPGSPFWKGKLAMEELSIKLFGTPLEDGFAQFDRVARRGSEIEQLKAIGGSDEEITLAALEMNREMVAGKTLIMDNTDDPAALGLLDAKLVDAARRMRSVVRGLDSAAKAAVVRVIATSKQIRRTVAAALAPTVIPTASLPAIEAQLGLQSGAPVYTEQPVAQPTASSGAGGGGNDMPRNAQDRSNDPTHGKDIDASQGCAIPARAQLGDALAPLTRVVCR